MSKSKVFVSKKDTHLNSAVTFCQFVKNGKQLLTLIGELHEEDFICENPNISIGDYCLEKAKNTNCKIFLEYCPGIDRDYNGNLNITNVLNIGSTNIRQTAQKLMEHNKGNIIVPYDIRSHFITKDGQRELYWDDDKLTFDNMYIKMIEPFEKYYESYINKHISLIKSDKYLKIINDINKEIHYHKEEILNLLSSKKNSRKIKDELRYFWANIIDLYIIIHMLNNVEDNEFIVLAGDHHIQNLIKILKDLNFFKKISENKGKKNQCVKVNLYDYFEF